MEELLNKHNLDAYITITSDEHLNEYLSPCDQRVRFLTNFTGSNGIAVTCKQNALYTDSRYFIQASNQSSYKLMKMGIDVHVSEFLNSLSVTKVGVCLALLDISIWNRWKPQFDELNIEIIGFEHDLVDLVWKDKPNKIYNEIIDLEKTGSADKCGGLLSGHGFLDVVGESRASKISRVREKLKDKPTVISDLDTIAWLLNLRGSDIEYNPVFYSYVIVTKDDLILFTDKEVSGINTQPYNTFYSHIKTLDEVYISGSCNSLVASIVPKHTLTDEIRQMQSIKNHVEIRGFKLAYYYDGLALTELFEWIENRLAEDAVHENRFIEYSVRKSSGEVLTKLPKNRMLDNSDFNENQIHGFCNLQELTEAKVSSGEMKSTFDKTEEKFSKTRNKLENSLLREDGVDTSSLESKYSIKEKRITASLNSKSLVNEEVKWRQQRSLRSQTESCSKDCSSIQSFVDSNSLENKPHKFLTEIEISEKLHMIKQKFEGYIQPSFESIVGTGSNSAIVHHSASDRRVHENDILLIDSGSQYTFGTTDTTRTLHFGIPTVDQRRDYTLVLKGQLKVMRSKFPKYITGCMLDAFARSYLWNDEKDFSHGTGHGVGHYLCVHEAPPNISPNSHKKILANQVFSIEPGFYKEGEYGIRIENLVLSSSEEYLGLENITYVPYQYKMIDFSMLNSEEIRFLNTFGKLMREKFQDTLRDKVGYNFLMENTQTVKQ